jgi:RNA polymerase sigma factor for flagellar operon FliA
MTEKHATAVTSETPGTAVAGATEALSVSPLYDKAAANAKAAFRAYAAEQKKLIEERLILDHLPLVHRVAQNIVSYLNRSSLSYEDLISAGTIGLVKAARDFDPAKDVEFKTYAYIKVRGAIIDELRSWTFTPSNVAKNIEQVGAVIRQYVEQTGSPPSDEEIASALDITLEKLYRLFEQARAQHFLSINGLVDGGPALTRCLSDTSSADPARSLERAELIDHLAAAIQALPQSQRHVIILYYQQEMTMKEVAAVLDVTESRVSQLHASALVRLSAELRRWRDEQ